MKSLIHPLYSLATLTFVTAAEIPQDKGSTTSSNDGKIHQITGITLLHHLTLDPSEIDNSESVTIRGGILNGAGPGKLMNIEQLKARLHKDPKLTTLNLRPTHYEPDEKYTLTRQVIDTIFTYTPHLVSLDLRDTTLSYLAAEALFEHLKENKTLTVLNLSNTKFGNSSAFSRCALDFEPNITDEAENAQMEKIKEEMSPGEMLMEIQGFLMSGEPLPHRHLDGSTDQVNRDIDSLVDCINHNTTLKHIILADNCLKTTDLEKILPALQKHYPAGTLSVDLRGNFIDFEQPKSYNTEESLSLFNFPSEININAQREENQHGECVIS